MSPPLTNHWSAGKAYTDTTKSAIRWGYIALPTPPREDHAFHSVHFHGRCYGKHGTFLLRIHAERRFASTTISCYLCPRAGTLFRHHQRGRSQLLRLPGLHPFAGERDSFQWVFLRTPTCAGQCPPTDERRRIRRTFQPDTSTKS